MAGEVLGEIWVVTGGAVVELRIFVRGVTGYRFKAGPSPQRVVAEGVPLSALVIQNVDAANDVEIGNDRSLAYGQGIKIPGNATLANGTVTAGASAGGGPLIACRAFAGGIIALVSGVNTTIALNSEEYDTDTMHDNAVNNSRITVRTAGLYVVTFNIAFDVNALGLRLAAILVNGVTFRGLHSQPPVGGDITYMSVSTQWQAVIGDYFEGTALQTSGGNLNLLATSYSPHLSAVKAA